MPNDKTQFDKFKEAAKELECGEDEKRFEETLKKVTKSEKEEKAKSE